MQVRIDTVSEREKTMENSDIKTFLNHTEPIGDLWYIASPYSHPCEHVIADRVNKVEKVVSALLSWDRVVPFSPVVYTHGIQKAGVVPRCGWYHFDLTFLKRADALIVLKLDGWESSVGVAMEIAFAKALDIPIRFYTYEQLVGGDPEDIPF